MTPKQKTDIRRTLERLFALQRVSCGNCPFASIQHETRVCTYSRWQHFVKWLTSCRVCVHHPTLQMYQEPSPS